MANTEMRQIDALRWEHDFMMCRCCDLKSICCMGSVSGLTMELESLQFRLAFRPDICDCLFTCMSAVGNCMRTRIAIYVCTTVCRCV